MMRLVRLFHAWLMATFIGVRGYTLYANGEIKQNNAFDRASQDTPASVDVDQFKTVFGDDAELRDGHFYVPESGLAGTFSRVDGQLVANADFVWNRAGIRTSPYVVWFCLLGFLVDLLSGVISLLQGNMTPGDGVVVVITLATFVGLMFLPRLMIELTGRAFHDERSQAIAKLSALVQHADQ